MLLQQVHVTHEWPKLVHWRLVFNYPRQNGKIIYGFWLRRVEEGSVEKLCPWVFLYFDEGVGNVLVLSIPELDTIKLWEQVVNLKAFYFVICFVAVHEGFVAFEGIVFSDDFGELFESWEFTASLVDDENVLDIEVIGVELVDHVFGFFFLLLFHKNLLNFLGFGFGIDGEDCGCGFAGLCFFLYHLQFLVQQGGIILSFNCLYAVLLFQGFKFIAGCSLSAFFFHIFLIPVIPY